MHLEVESRLYFSNNKLIFQLKIKKDQSEISAYFDHERFYDYEDSKINLLIMNFSAFIIPS